MELVSQSTMRIGLALSGGGVRAAIFHLGVLSRLASDNLLEHVTFLSTVSGGSLVTGLVYSIAGNRWPSSSDFLYMVLPQARHAITQTNMQRGIVRRCLLPPWRLPFARAKIVAESIRHTWGITGTLQDIPEDPRWVINATSYESGKN